MEKVRIAIVQTSWKGSREKMKEQYSNQIAEAACQGVKLICLQEFTLSPYFASTFDPAGFGRGGTVEWG